MRNFALLIASMACGLSAPAAAQTYVYHEVVEEWVETSASRFVSSRLAEAEQNAIASYGPFRVLDDERAALVGITTSYSPAQFAQLLANHPAIRTIEFLDCAGTHDDIANMQLGRMIRARGIATIVPEGGSVRSGAVELFLSGATREISEGAEFAVHAWMDDRGRGAWDYAEGAPEHQRYLDYYQEMGMDSEQATRFYAMTNSVPFESAMWLTGDEMRGWIAAPQANEPQIAEEQAQMPRLAYLDLGPALN